jgi:ribonuclease G
MEWRVDIIDGVQIAAVLSHKKIIAVFARPNDTRLWAGDVVPARVTRYADAQKAYFTETDLGPVMVPHKKNAAIKPGDAVTVRIERPAMRDKDARGVFTPDAPARPPFTDLLTAEYPDAVFTPQDLDDYDDALNALRGHVVDIGNGVHLVITQTPACVTVDVNAAAPNMTPLDVNKQAATALFNHMALRNLQGQIVVDFLRLRDAPSKKEFDTHIRALAADHRRPVTLYEFTRMGLFELTRDKRGLSLNDVFSLIQV